MRHDIALLMILTYLFVVLGPFRWVTAEEVGALNQACNTKSDCASVGYVCGRNGTCWCAKFFVPNKKGNRCVGGVGQMCKYDEHCVDGAFCEHQVKCMCKDNFYPEDDGVKCSSAVQVYGTTFILKLVTTIILLLYILIF